MIDSFDLFVSGDVLHNIDIITLLGNWARSRVRTSTRATFEELDVDHVVHLHLSWGEVHPIVGKPVIRSIVTVCQG